MPKGGALEDGVLVSRSTIDQGGEWNIKCWWLNQYFIFHKEPWSIVERLTNTPRKTSGHGWTLVNVGLTMAIAILDGKWVRGEKWKKGSGEKIMGGPFFSIR